MEVQAGPSRTQLKRLDVTDTSNSGGPYPILGRYFHLGSLSRTKSTKVVRVYLTQAGRRIHIRPAGKNAKPYHDLRIVGANDSGGYIGESTFESSILR